MKRTVIIVIVCLLLCGGVIFGAIYLRGGRQVESSGTGTDEEISTLNNLESKRTQLTRKIKALENSLERTQTGNGTVSFVCVGAQTKAYSVVFEETKKRGYPGVLVLTEDFSVGSPDCITSEQLSEMLAAGWEVAVRFSAADTDPVGSVKQLLQTASDLGIENVKTVYFARDGYSNAYDETLVELGFECSIYHGERLSSDTDVTLPAPPAEDSLWQVYSYGYVSSRKEYFLETVEKQGGSIAFEISFDTENLNSYCTDYGIRYLITTCVGYNQDKLSFLTVFNSREYLYSLYHGGQQSEVDGLQRQLSTLKTELSEIEKQIKDLRSNLGN